MSSEILASNKWSKRISGKPYGIANLLLLEVTGELVKHKGNSYPHYSITGSISREDKRYRDPIITCGAIHSEILAHFPELAPLVTAHLSDADGTPLHAAANARYWAGLSSYADGRVMSPRDNYGRVEIELDADGVEWSPVTLAKHLRVSVELARDIRGAMVSGLSWERIATHAKLTELWSTQAGAARALLVTRERVSA